MISRRTRTLAQPFLQVMNQFVAGVCRQPETPAFLIPLEPGSYAFSLRVQAVH